LYNYTKAIILIKNNLFWDARCKSNAHSFVLFNFLFPTHHSTVLIGAKG